MLHSSSGGRGKRGECLADRLREAVYLFVEEVEMGEDGPDEQGVLSVAAACERFA
jgi:hypothetical protein